MLIESHVYIVVSMNISDVASVVVILIPMVHYISIGDVVSSVLVEFKDGSRPTYSTKATSSNNSCNK